MVLQSRLQRVIEKVLDEARLGIVRAGGLTLAGLAVEVYLTLLDDDIIVPPAGTYCSSPLSISTARS